MGGNSVFCPLARHSWYRVKLYADVSRRLLVIVGSVGFHSISQMLMNVTLEVIIATPKQNAATLMVVLHATAK